MMLTDVAACAFSPPTAASRRLCRAWREIRQATSGAKLRLRFGFADRDLNDTHQRVRIIEVRDDFSERTKRILAERVGHRCSRDGCDALTAGPQTEASKSLNVGVAAHITAASSLGPRYDRSLSPSQRRDVTNGIWLCQTCAKLVDNDPKNFTATSLRVWKSDAEARALSKIGKTAYDLPGETQSQNDATAREEKGEFRLLAGHDTERLTTDTTTVITQKKTVEPTSLAFDRYEFFFWQDADGPVELVRSDVLGQMTGRPIHHSVVILEHDPNRLRLQLIVDRPRPFGVPLTFIAQVSCENYYPHLFTTGTGYTELQVRQANPSYTYRLELPNRAPFRDIKATVVHRRAPTTLVERVEGGDLVHDFGPAALEPGDSIRFVLSNLALIR